MDAFPLYLNGRFVTTQETMAIRDPATGEIFARMSTCDAARVAQAVDDAHAAFQAWRSVVGKVRGDGLLAIARQLERRQQEIATTITRENGKPLAQSAGEVAMAIDHLRWFAEEARRSYGRIVPPQVDGKRHLVLKTPLGVVAAISPWNFPLVLAVRKIAPALAAGCTVVHKPASATPLCSVQFAECVHEAGLPAGVYQLVAGKAQPIGDALLEHPRCRKISFTGSTAVGEKLIGGAAATIKPLSLELGGCGPLLVFDDADLERAVAATMIAKFRNTGQSCIAANRIYVQRSIYQPFLEHLTRQTQALSVGNGLEPGVEIGPLIDADAVAHARRQVQQAVDAGARLLCGGGPAANLPGYFFQPTVLADVPDTAACFREETFAPVAPVAAFDTEEEAVAKANASRFGLSAYAFTRDLNRAWRLMESIEAGMIAINDGVPTTSQCPFGGVKESGWGRELGTEGLEAFLDTKHISLGIA